MTILTLANVVKTYDGQRALDGIELSVSDNQYISVLGPSGSGKTTLLRVIAGFEEPDSGALTFAGQRLVGVPAHRRGIGFVFQNFALFPHLNVRENVAFGLENREVGALPKKAAAAKVRELISLVGLDGLEERAVTQISGGQRQRVALARTLVTEPRLVLLDEPLGALDANLRTRMRTELRAIRARLGVSFLHVTGSESEALAIGDTVLVLDRGRIAQAADPDTVYNRPARPSVARFLNCYNLFEGSIAGDDFVSSVGRFALSNRDRQPSDSEAYAIRFDRISVQEAGRATARDEVAVAGTFIASEYTGASVNSFFTLDDGRVFEVETHLSHRKPETYEPRARYGLVWKRDAALVFG